ncbi:dUTP diphosphatase [Sulfobacillus sp. DSM 109850]|uniref:dUTP diphosphatase n=2 Tax=Sulfobacillus harzensis TaxID=2729629 RepID=A0A7Y0L3H0_9FIRM|nr:dUTP diphosphatase [Sulfobacillus harzensis]
MRFARVTSAPDALIPTRATKGSAGYDFAAYIPKPVTIEPGEMRILRTGIKVYMPDDWVLFLVSRSNVGIKRRLLIPNSLGVIDSDHADNPENEGEIFLAFYNFGDEPQVIKPGQLVAQGIFLPFGRVADDRVTAERVGGGIGSTTPY